MKAKYKINNSKIEIYFDSVPPEIYRTSLKISGWRWVPSKECWSNSNTRENMSLAKELCNGQVSSEKKQKIHTKNDIIYDKTDAFVNTIIKYTKYDRQDISLSRDKSGICCKGIAIKREEKLVKIYDSNSKIITGGWYCPRCHKLFFTEKAIKNSVNSMNNYLLNIPFINVDIGYQVKKKRISINPYKNYDDTSYVDKYNKNIKMFIVMRSLIEGKEISLVKDILKKYGYVLDKINDLPVDDRINNDLLRLFSIKSIEDFCFISDSKMKDGLHRIIESKEPKRISLRDKDEKNGRRVAFEYGISDEMRLVLYLPCNLRISSSGRIHDIMIKDHNIKADFNCKSISSRYSYVLKEDDEGYNYLISKEGFKRLLENVKKGFFDDADYEDEINVQLLKTADFLVRSTNYACVNNNHNIVRINAAVKVKTANGIYEIHIPAAYCEKCNRYYILDRYFESLKKYGYICCKVDTIDSLRKNQGSKFATFQDKHILSLYGYNVNQQEDLSERERREILDFVIDNGILSRNEVVNHLEQNISLRKHNILMNTAIKRWEEDIEYVRKRQKVAGVVKVDSITVPVKTIILDSFHKKK